MRIPQIQKSYRHLKRYRQIVSVFVKYGFAEIFEHMNIALRLRIKTRLLRRKTDLPIQVTPARRLRMALQELGPTFVKFGQMLSTRSFLLPPAFINELSQLQDRVSAVPFEQIEGMIEKELLAPISKLFAEFDPEPLASASIAQVHKARLHSGEHVVVKIQRPRIQRLIQTDLAILEELARLMERHLEESQNYNPLAMVQELRRGMIRELDFSNEARNIEQFSKLFAKDPDVIIPKVYWEYSSLRIVTLSFIDGVKISDQAALEQLGISPRRVAHIGTQFILKQIFHHGLFHADPHPGNLFITAQGKIALVDFGLVGRLDEALMDEISDLLLGVWQNDVDLMLRVFINIGALDSEADIQPLRSELTEFLGTYYGLSLQQLNMLRLIEEGTEIISRHHLRIPASLFLLVKTLGAYEDLGRKLYPEFNFIEELRPFIPSIIRRRLDPGKIAYESSKSLRDLYDLFKMMPREIELIFRRLRKGRMAIELQHRGLEKLIQEMDRSFNRLSFSLIIASLMVASSMILVLNKGPQIFGLPFFGVVGYVLAGVFGIGLVIAILRSGKL